MRTLRVLNFVLAAGTFDIKAFPYEAWKRKTGYTTSLTRFDQNSLSFRSAEFAERSLGNQKFVFWRCQGSGSSGFLFSQE
ncbi:Uncharacterized protein dnm_003820 [Desulfonema magnum]|uniref:Uncharacterized protein n=1 Tax=Desulfonema magnum TaxID=45655 RepID=A0A975GL33_9BACT|nr:Uncharacterized protein dnm_003820 [Desulfonema magnum]